VVHRRLRLVPMIRAERTIQQAVTDAMLKGLLEGEESQHQKRDQLKRLIETRNVRAVFHPIVRMRDGQAIGHEALTRPGLETSFTSVEELFAFAESTDLLMDFERLCRTTAIRSAATLPGRGLVFLNASTRAVEDPEWQNGAVDAQLAESHLQPDDVVVEITERMAVDRQDAFQAALRGFKARGYRVAVDDMGAGHASLQSLAAIEPDFLKFDVSLVREIDRSSIKRSLLESLRTLAEKIHAQVIAEGVEREQERATLLALGIDLGQGFYFHRE
jgi:EAL domain-containing protein (putative c-di-GMP-specific phosphodiesterase class I)